MTATFVVSPNRYDAPLLEERIGDIGVTFDSHRQRPLTAASLRANIEGLKSVGRDNYGAVRSWSLKDGPTVLVGHPLRHSNRIDPAHRSARHGPEQRLGHDERERRRLGGRLLRTAGRGRERNWIQTMPGKGWFTILRLYGALEPWFDKTWRPGEIELVNRAALPRDD